MVKKLKLEELTPIFKFLTIKPINRKFLHNYKKKILKLHGPAWDTL